MNNNIVQEVARGLSNYTYDENLEATKQLMELFDRVAKNPLKTSYDYIKMYDDNFYTYQTWEELIDSEKESGDGFTEEECTEQLNNSIWQLPCGWYIQAV